MSGLSSLDRKSGYRRLTGSHLYFLAMIVYLFRAELVTTNFTALIDTQALRSIGNLIVCFLLIIKILLFDRYTVKRLLQMAAFLAVGVLSTLATGYDMIFILYLFIMSAKSVSFYKIVRLHFIYALSFVLAAFIASQIGIIENTISYRGSIPRQSFGIIYCTDFAAHVFYLMVSYVYLRGNKLSYRALAVFAALTWWVYANCDARLDCICMACLVVFLLVRKIRAEFGENTIYSIPKHAWGERLMTWSMPVCAAFSIGISYFFSSNSMLWLWANTILNNRLTQSAKAVSMYSFNLFGQIVEVQGQVGTNANISEYFFIDSSFLLYGLRYGLVFLLIFCIGSVVVMKREFKKKNAIFCVLFFLIAINSIFSHHLAELAYNPFLLILLAEVGEHPNLPMGKKKRKLKFSAK